MKRQLTRSFYLLFTLIFVSVVINLLFRNGVYPVQAAFLLPLAMLVLLVLLAAYWLLKRYETRLARRYRLILCVTLAAVAAVQIWLGFGLRFTPAFDMSAIYDGAIEWAQTGTFANRQEYMYYFPHNLGSMAFLRILFIPAAWFGVTDFFAVGIVINALMCVSAFALVSLVANRLWGAARGLFALLLCLCCLPFWFSAAVFYTDMLSLLFPVLSFGLYLLARGASGKKRTALMLAAGTIAGVGALIKFTVLIALIAIGIDALFHLPLKKALSGLGAAILTVVVIHTAFNGWIYENYLDREESARYNTPPIHFVMMGLSGEYGGYDFEDYVFTRSFTDTKLRDEQILLRIRERLADKGFTGLLDFGLNKSKRLLGDGTLAMSVFLDDTPAQRHPLHRFILYGGGRAYGAYATATTAFLAALYLILLLYAISRLFAQHCASREELAPWLSFFGVFAFLMAWESAGRYIAHALPVRRLRG